MKKILAYIKIIRPANSIMMGLGVAFSEIIALKSLPSIKTLLYGFGSGFFLTSASMVINDIYDREIDLINAPNRPIPSGLISVKEAWIYGVLLILAGMISAYLINTYCFVIALVSSLVSLTYNMRFKKYGLIGNFMVSFCVAMPFLFGNYAVFGKSNLLNIFSLAAFLVNTGREIIKGIADVEGDAKRDVRSIARTYGIKTAVSAAIIFFIIAIPIVFIPFIYSWVSFNYLLIIIFSVIGLLYESYKLLRECDVDSALKSKKRVLIYMFLALIAILVGGYYE